MWQVYLVYLCVFWRRILWIVLFAICIPGLIAVLDVTTLNNGQSIIFVYLSERINACFCSPLFWVNGFYCMTILSTEQIGTDHICFNIL